jgi:hypothetical protein
LLVLYLWLSFKGLARLPFLSSEAKLLVAFIPAAVLSWAFYMWVRRIIRNLAIILRWIGNTIDDVFMVVSHKWTSAWVANLSFKWGSNPDKSHVICT